MQTAQQQAKSIEEKVVNILWTSGWDSTFRMLQLARSGRTIQPHYVIDVDRSSALKEIRQMRDIKADILAKYPDCKIRNTNFIELSTISVPEKYEDAYTNLNNERFLGSQAMWIAAISDDIEDLEMCIHKDDNAEFFIRKLLTKPEESKDVETIYGRLALPLLEYTKLGMEEDVRKNGDLDILDKSWFCYYPINGTPCGICNPCKYSLEEGMRRRFSLRGRIYSKIPFLIRCIHYVVRKFI